MLNFCGSKLPSESDDFMNKAQELQEESPLLLLLWPSQHNSWMGRPADQGVAIFAGGGAEKPTKSDVCGPTDPTLLPSLGDHP